MGYSQWRSFEQVVEKAILACHNSGYEPGDHFARVRKMVEIGSGAERAIDDIALSRYRSYLWCFIALNRDVFFKLADGAAQPNMISGQLDVEELDIDLGLSIDELQGTNT